MEVTPTTFDAEVLRRSHELPVVVDFWAPWCQPCLRLAPILEAAAKKAEGSVIVVKINVEEHEVFKQRFGIQGIPCLKAFVDGQVVSEFVGLQPMAAILKWFATFSKPPVDPVVEKARTHHAAGAFEDAWKLLQQHPGVDAARLRLQVEAARVTNTSDVDLRYLSALEAAIGRHWERALGGLLAIVESDRAYRDDGARQRMLDILTIIGERSPIISKWRQKLMFALY